MSALIVSSLADDADFRLEHGGMSRSQWNERTASFRREKEREDASESVRGEPPPIGTRGLTPKRARYACYFAWRMAARKEVAGLETKRAELTTITEAPAATEDAIRGVVSKEAGRLLGRVRGSESADERQRLDKRLQSERYAAEAAREALTEIDQQIELARLRVEKLNERESEFLNPAIAEAAEQMGLGTLYLKKIAELRELVELILGLSQVAGGYGSELGKDISCHVQGDTRIRTAETVHFPGFDFASTTEERQRYMISARGQPDVWMALKHSLLLDPYHRALVPLPKS